MKSTREKIGETRISQRVPPTLKDLFIKAAEQRGQKPADALREAVRLYIKSPAA